MSDKRIEELTPEQEAKFEEFVEKWTAIGLDTGDINEEEVLKAIPEYYKAGEIEPPQQVIFCQSIWEAIEIGSQLVNKGTPKEKADFVWSARVGMSLWAGWKARLDFMKYIGVNIPEYEPTFQLAQQCCYVFPFDNVCLVVRKPSKIFLNQNGELHHESAQAIEWPDGFGGYYLNGVDMTGCEWFFTEKLSDEDKAKRIFATENVEQRGEMLKVFGMSKVYQALPHKKIAEREDGYEVLAIDIGTGRMEEALKMVNPSTGEIHVEFVGRETKTVEQALFSRWPKRIQDKYGKYKEAKARA